MRNTLASGRRAGIRTAAGVVCGQAVWVLAASVGLAALLVASEPAFVALKLAGAAYLIYLGCRSLAAALRPPCRATRPARGRRVAAAASCARGCSSNLANPKMAIFFSSLLPQFGYVVCRAARARRAVLCADDGLAQRLRGRDRGRRRRPATRPRAPRARRSDRHRARRARRAARRRRSFTVLAQRDTARPINAAQRCGSSRNGAWLPGMTSMRAPGMSAAARRPISGPP